MSGATRDLYATGRGHLTKQAVLDHEMYDCINLRSENLRLHAVYLIPAEWLREHLSCNEREAVQKHVIQVIKSKDIEANLREAVGQTNDALLSLRLADLDAAIPTVVTDPTDTSTTVPTSKHSSTTNTSTMDTSSSSRTTVRGPLQISPPNPQSYEAQEDDANAVHCMKKWVKQVEEGRVSPSEASERSNATTFHTARTNVTHRGASTSASTHRAGSELSVSEIYAEELLVLAQRLDDLEVAINDIDVPHMRNDACQAVYTARRSIEGAWSTAGSTQVEIAEAQADTAAAERITEDAMTDMIICKSLEQVQLQQDGLPRDPPPFEKPQPSKTPSNSSTGADVQTTPQVAQAPTPQESRYQSSPPPPSCRSQASMPGFQPTALVSTQGAPPYPIHPIGAAPAPSPTPQQYTNLLHAQPPHAGTNYNIYAPEARELVIVQNNANHPVPNMAHPTWELCYSGLVDTRKIWFVDAHILNVITVLSAG